MELSKEDLKKKCYELYDNWPPCIKLVKQGLQEYPNDPDFNYIMSIGGFYTNDKDLALISTQKLIILNNRIDNCINNFKYYDLKIKTTFNKKLEFEKEENFFPLNPSICRFKDNFYCIVRTTNYLINNENKYIVQDGGKNDWNNFKNINYLLKMDLDLNIIESNKLIYDKDEYFEDCRLFVYNKNLYFTATNFIKVFSNFQKWIALFKIEDNNKVIKIKEFKINGSMCEKNWLPFHVEYPIGQEEEENESILIIKNHNPMTILKYDFEKDNLDVYSNIKYNFNDVKFRGSASPKEYKDRYLYIIHEVYNSNYYNRFIYMNKDLKIEKMSGLFKILNERIEFIGGLEIYNDEIIISYGVMDKEAYICKMKLEELDKMLIY